MEIIHILLILDNYLLIDGITAMLHRQVDIAVVAYPEDCDTLMQLRGLNVPPDIVLMDLDLKKLNSLNLMSLFKEEIPDVRIIAINILPEQVDIIEFVRAGGHGFILKNAPPGDWIETIKAVASGEKILPPTMTHSLFAQIMTNPFMLNQFKSCKEHPPECIQLTLRQREVVDLIAEGLSNKEIAETLYITTFTVKNHVHNVLEKLALSTRLQIAAYARRWEN